MCEKLKFPEILYVDIYIHRKAEETNSVIPMGKGLKNQYPCILWVII